jgi:hypothetical protein
MGKLKCNIGGCGEIRAGSYSASGRDKGTSSVEPRESFGLGVHEDSRPSETVRYFAVQKSLFH